jgi:hypothetical protein
MLKSIVLLNLGFLLFSFSGEAQTKFIGEISNGSVKLTVDKADILSKYNRNLLKATGIDGQFTDVKIKTTDNKNYYLVFSSSMYKSSLSLINLAGKFAPTGTSCTTPDCASEPHGCEVTYGTGPEAGTVYCSPCGNGGKCTKTSSSTSLLE